jgi:hypothetical protein
MFVKKSLSNEYYICLRQAQEPIPWNLTDTAQAVSPDCFYFGKVFEAMEKSLEVSGLVFYLTWDIHQLPSYGQNIVAVVLGDEWCRIPTYFHKVRAVFKCYGTRPILGCNPLLKPSYLNFLTLIQFIRNLLIHLPYSLNYLLHKFKTLQADAAKIPPIYDIPLGYFNQLELPIKEIETRLYDVYFAGSVGQNCHNLVSLKRWIGTPKSISRQELISAINQLEKSQPKLKIELLISPDSLSYAMSNAAGINYSEKMINAKICLVPRGTSFETFRFFEALRYGCIVITEALPSRWFYNESPAIQIEDWSELGEIVEKLLANKHLMQEKHKESLKWWETKCSEAVVGAYMAEKLSATQLP